MTLGAVLPVVACLVSAPPAVDVHALRRDVVAVLDEWVDGYLVDQNLVPKSIRRGQFHGSDNMRLQECTALIAWLHTTPDSRHHGSQAALDAAVASIDYMCRAQGSNGGFNEYHGWCGAPDRTPGKSSVAGFTMYGIARAIERLAPLDVMRAALADDIAADGPAMPAVERRAAWQRLLRLAMENLYAGSGRGHSANQDLCALAAVYAVNRAWMSLAPSASPLKSEAQVAAMRDEIFYGSPRDARNEYAGKWFSDMGLLFEGRPYAGYDANYAAVTLAYTGLCGDYDPEAARFGAKYWSALEYFFVPDVDSPLGISMEDGVSRRVSRGAARVPPMWALGLARALHPAGERAYAVALPRFAEDVSARMALPSPHTYQIASYLYADWLDRLATFTATDYRLPAERSGPWSCCDPEAGTLVTKGDDGVLTYYVEPWDTPDGAREHVWGEAPRDIPSRHVLDGPAR